jgi:hypothetical protein
MIIDTTSLTSIFDVVRTILQVYIAILGTIMFLYIKHKL